MADHDLYAILGVAHDAGPEEIKAAWRDLARELHPDRNPGDPEAEARFQEVSAAWAVLSDPDKRLVYDTFGSGAIREGWTAELAETVRAQQKSRSRAKPASRRPTAQPGGRTARPRREPVTSEVRAEAGTRWNKDRASRYAPTMRAWDARAEVVLDLRDTVRGGVRVVTMTETGPCPGCEGTGKRKSGRFCSRCQGKGTGTFERRVEVDVPLSVANGDTVRLRGEAVTGPTGHRGDLYVTFVVRPDPVFEREGLNLRVQVPISRALAERGGPIQVPTLEDPVQAEIPAGTPNGFRVRLPGRGMPGPGGRAPGDLYATVVVL